MVHELHDIIGGQAVIPGDRAAVHQHRAAGIEAQEGTQERPRMLHDDPDDREALDARARDDLHQSLLG